MLNVGGLSKLGSSLYYEILGEKPTYNCYPFKVISFSGKRNLIIGVINIYGSMETPYSIAGANFRSGELIRYRAIGDKGEISNSNISSHWIEKVDSGLVLCMYFGDPNEQIVRELQDYYMHSVYQDLLNGLAHPILDVYKYYAPKSPHVIFLAAAKPD